MTKSWPLGLRAMPATIACAHQLVALRRAQRPAQVGRVLLAQAHVHGAGAGHPHAVAALAEIVGQRRDEAEPAAGLRDLARSAPARRSGRGCRSASSARPAGRGPATAAGTGRSGRRSISPSGMVSISVRSKPSAPHQATIRSSSSSLTPLSATALILTWSPAAFAASIPAITLSNLPQRVIASNRSRSQRVQRDVDPPHARPCQSPANRAELAAVGGERQLVQRAAAHVPAELLDQPHHVAPDQRLAAGEPDLAHAQADERRAQPVQLLQRQQLGLGQERHVLGHAVDAAEVAAVGDRHPHVADGPAERVDHHRQQPPRSVYARADRSRMWASCERCPPAAGRVPMRIAFRAAPHRRGAARARDELQAAYATVAARGGRGRGGAGRRRLHAGDAARATSTARIPIYGMNLGTVGFLLNAYRPDGPARSGSPAADPRSTSTPCG